MFFRGDIEEVCEISEHLVKTAEGVEISRP